jgi:uncharacterized protein
MAFALAASAHGRGGGRACSTTAIAARPETAQLPPDALCLRGFTMRTVGLLIASNIFMTAAWYGHLRFKGVALWKVVLVSWGIAFFEYCLQVPANRWGYGHFTAYQLKILQEVITLGVFVTFSAIYLGEVPRWNTLVAFVLILAAVGFAFLPRTT